MRYHFTTLIPAALLMFSLALPTLAFAEDDEIIDEATPSEGELLVPISRKLDKLEFTYRGENFTIERNQDLQNRITGDFSKTSRQCPPFCIQPMSAGAGVDTIGELEVVSYIRRMADGENILLIDSRIVDWAIRGTIPGAINIPWTTLTPSKGAETVDIIATMTTIFGARLLQDLDTAAIDKAVSDKRAHELFDFTEAKTLVFFCNGMWCGQSPTNIIVLRRFGYPVEKMKWYRGGMQDWAILGFNMTQPLPLPK